MSAMALVQRQMAIKIEQDELAKAMETSLKENEALARKRKREEEDKRDRDPVKAYGCATTMSEAALKRMFVDGNGRNKATMELCELRRKQSGGISARETIEDMFEQIGASVENAQTEEDVGKILTNSMEMLDEQALKMPLKAGAVPQIFASEEALNGENRVEEVVELDSSSSEEEEEGEKG